uniref:LRRCT domain-containing protein n=1 Tax=Macrostomum lignano TaxID=282301 RepID=A0A1I8F7J1_9PLAT
RDAGFAAAVPSEFLSCDRNRLADILRQRNGTENSVIVENKLQSLKISPPPKRLECLDVSDNRLDSLPDCLWPSGRASLLRLHAGGNEIRRLPADIWRCAKLQSLRYQRLCFHLTPALVELNLANNQLVELPKLPLRNSGNRLQVLTASFNQFSDADVSFLAENFGSSLRTLLLAFNRLTRLTTILRASRIEHIRQPAEDAAIDFVSSRTPGYDQGSLQNCLQRLPDLSDSPRLRTLDVGCNSKLSGSVRNLMESRLSFLDLSCNQQMGMSCRTWL